MLSVVLMNVSGNTTLVQSSPSMSKPLSLKVTRSLIKAPYALRQFQLQKMYVVFDSFSFFSRLPLPLSSGQLRSRQSSASAYMHYANGLSTASDMKAFCSHTPLGEGYTDNAELSAEELEQKAANKKHAQVERTANSLKKIKLRSPERKRQDFRKNTQTFREANRETTRESCRRRTKIASVSLTQSVSVHSAQHQLDAHLKTSAHLKKVAELRLSSSESSSGSITY